MPSTAATTRGMYSGLQPAMTALIATFSAVTDTARLVMKATCCCASRRAASNRAHPVRRWRDDRQTVGPPLLEAEFDRVGDIRDLVPLGRECGRHLYS